MNKLIMTRGLPGSGKSHWSKDVVSKDPSWKRVNKDDLRSMIDGGTWSKVNETYIINARDLLIKYWLSQKLNVICDDTNFTPKHEETLRQIAANHGAEFEVKFFDTPVEECIARDARRTVGHVGKKLIMEWYNKYVKKPVEPVLYNPELNDCYIFDVDGTLAKMYDRAPYEWSRVGEDLPNKPVIDVYNKLRASSKPSDRFIILSGRDEVCLSETSDWLTKHLNYFDFILMRPAGDMRKDSIVKKELYDTYIKGKYNVLGVFDDRNQVVELWRSLGLTCFQVDEGDF